jgi:molybdopterin synthase catalytic subunit
MRMKRKHLRDGTVGDWVEARGEDDAAAQRWR